jgi:glycosyltransferase involved in cell wall biosynthesis
MINVCYMVDAAFIGGAERYVTRLATGLDRNRFKPSVVMREPDHEDSGLDEWRLEVERAGVAVTVLPMDLPWRPWRAIGVWRAVASAAPHVVHVNLPGPQDGQLGLLVPLSRMAGANGVLVTEHLPMVSSTWKRRLFKRISYRWVDKVATVCHANVPYLVGDQFVPDRKAVVVHNALRSDYGSGVEGTRAELAGRFGVPAGGVLVVFVGNLFKHKGLHRIIRALVQAPDRPWHLVVVGVGPEREPCIRRLNRAGLADRATFLGRVSPDDVERLLSIADVLALPSTQEGMPYVVLEAMASGVPVVATAVYGIPEMVAHGETGLLVEPRDDAGLREALISLVDGTDAREKMGVAARRRFEQLFTLDRQLSAMEEIYLELAGVPPHSRVQEKR